MEHNLRRLGDLENFKVAPDDPDPRGWGVRTPRGDDIGQVEELIVDPDARKVRYLEVALDRDHQMADGARYLSIPIEDADLDRPGRSVVVSGLPDEVAHGHDQTTPPRERLAATRRPFDGDPHDTEPRITEKEIRVPIVEEEIVVERRPVVKEEIVISRERVGVDQRPRRREDE
jgi:hypothetical protein